MLNPEKGYLLGGTLPQDAEVEQIAAELESFRALNPRVERLVFHASLRLAPGETLSDEQWMAAARSYLAGMGFDDNAYIVARHHDGGSDHIHIVACRIRADGTCVSDSNDFARGERLVRELEVRFGLRQVSPSHLTDARALSRGELAQALRSGAPSARLELQELIEEVAGRSPHLRDLVAGLEAEGVGVVLHHGPDGQPRGISFELDGVVLSGSSLGRGFTLGGLARRFGLTWSEAPVPAAPEGAANPVATQIPEDSQSELRARLAAQVRSSAQQASDLATFLDSLEAQGITVRFHLDGEGRPRGISYRLGSEGMSGSALGKDLTFGGLAKHHGIDVDAPGSRELIAPRAVTSANPAQKPKVGGKGGRDGGDAEEDVERLAAELTHRLHQAVEPRQAKPEGALQSPSFTAFGRAAEAKGVELRVFTKTSGERVAVGYFYGGKYFRASSLGPELTLRGLDSYFSIAIDPQADRDYLEEVKVIVPESEFTPEDQEKLTRLVADSIAKAADGAAGDTQVFLEKLKEAEVSVRLYLSPEGDPRQVAFSCQGAFFTEKALGREYGLRGLAEYFDLTFDPARDADLIQSRSVRLGKGAVVDRESLASWVEERILAAAVDQPSFADFHQRLLSAGVKLHIYSDGKRQGLSYEHRGVNVSASSLGPAYTLKGLEATLGVAIDPELDDPLLTSLTTRIEPPKNGIDLRDEVRQAVAAAAQSSSDLGDFVRRAAGADVRVLFHLDEAGQVRGISYRLDDQSFSGRELGPAYTAHGLVNYFGLTVGSPGDLAVLEANSLRPRSAQDATDPMPPPLWTVSAASQLSTELQRLRTPHGASELGRASAELRLSPLEALRTAAHAQYLFYAATHPAAAARLLLREVPGGQVVDGALALFGAFRSPAAATSYALRLAAHSLHGAAELSRPRHPGDDRLARQLLQAYTRAALSDAPTLEAYVARLEIGGVQVRLESHVREPRLLYHLGDQAVPADQLGREFTLRALKDRFGATDADLPALLLEPSPRPSRPGADPGDPGGPTERPRLPSREALPGPGDPGPFATGHGAPRASAARQPDPSPSPGAQPPDGEPLRTAPRPPGPASEPPALRSAGDLRGPLPADPADLSPAALASASPSPQDLRVRDRAGGGLPAPVAGSPQPAPRAPLAELQDTLKRQLEAFGGSRFDLRVAGAPDRPLNFKRNLSAEEVVRSAPWLRALNRKGATVEIRPSGARHLQILRNISEENLAQATARGFEPALAVQVGPGRYDVWLRHAGAGSEVPEEVLTYARRVARLEYGMSARQESSFGALVGFGASPSSPEAGLVSVRKEPYSRSKDLLPYLTRHVGAARAELDTACERLGLPSLTRFREQSPSMSPREGDLAWARLALAKGMPQEQVLRAVALQGSRAKAAEAPRALAYAARVLSSALRSTLNLGPDAAATATLHALGSAVSLPVAVLRLAQVGVTVVRRLVVGF